MCVFEGGGGLLTWQSVEIMATATVADRRRSVISAVFCTLVVRRIPVLQLQRHHRSHIPPFPPTSPLLEPGRASRMTVATIRSDSAAPGGGVFTGGERGNRTWPHAHTNSPLL